MDISNKMYIRNELSYKIMNLEMDEFLEQTSLDDQRIVYAVGERIHNEERTLFVWDTQPAILYSVLFYRELNNKYGDSKIRKAITMANKLSEIETPLYIIEDDLAYVGYMPQGLDILVMYEDNIIGAIEWIASNEFSYDIVRNVCTISDTIYMDAATHMAMTYHDKIQDLGDIDIAKDLPCTFNDSVVDIYSMIFMNHIIKNINDCVYARLPDPDLETLNDLAYLCNTSAISLKGTKKGSFFKDSVGNIDRPLAVINED